jgi:hypothetical protein
MAKTEERADREITTQPSFLRFEYKYIDEKNAIAKASETRPCRESDETIPTTDIAMHMMANILKVVEKVLTNKIEKAKTEKTAMSADAKFGFPTVAITAL